MWQLILLALGALAASALESETRKRGGAGIIYYRTRDGRADYAFSIERHGNNTYRAYIVSQPSYGSRDTGPHETHRLTDSAGRQYVCWTRPLRSEADARGVAAAWADASQEYIRTGQGF